MIEKKKSMRPALLALAVAAPWIIFATIYFGSPIPHSLLEKAGFFRHVVLNPMEGVIGQWVYHYYSLFCGNPIHWLNLLNTPYTQLLSTSAPFFICFLIASVKIFKYQRMFIPLVIFPVIYALLFTLAGAGLPFYWYFIPTNAFFMAVTFSGMFFLVQEITSRFILNFFKKRSFQVSAVVVTTVCLIIALIRLFYYYDPLNNMLPSAINQHISLYKEPVYKEVAEFLNQRNDNPSTLTLCGEVGAFGYYSKYKVWDGHLTTPRTIERAPLLIYKYKPKFITFLGLFPPAKPLNDQPAEWIFNSNGDKYVKIFHMNRGDKALKIHNVVAYEFIPGK
jgi:hypothetical protein